VSSSGTTTGRPVASCVEDLDRESGAVVGWSSASAIWRRDDATARRTPSVGTYSAGEGWARERDDGRVQSNKDQQINLSEWVGPIRSSYCEGGQQSYRGVQLRVFGTIVIIKDCICTYLECEGGDPLGQPGIVLEGQPLPPRRTACGS
jgi:hypothetical protein